MMSGPILWRWCAVALFALARLAAPVSADNLSGRLLNNLGERLLDDLRDGRLDEFDFLTAALVAGGAEDECELSGWLDCYADHRRHLLDSLPTSPPVEQLRAIHDALHEQILKGKYRTAASDLRLALSNGDFNCLSSLAIYFDLCQAADVPVEIWLARGHVFLRAGLEGKTIVIEPGMTEWSIRTTARRHCVRQITPVELLGKFYYNRGVELLKDRQFDKGIELLETSLAIDPADADARANLVAGLNNWAVEHCRADRYGDAAALIEQGLQLDPAFAPLIANEQLVRAKLSK
jgi:tetratricopeptide (TPR) repeat protein